MKVTPTQLRQDIYRILDQVLSTGVPVEIERKGRRLKIVPAEPPVASRLDRLEQRPEFLRCDPEELIHLDWSGDWRP